MTQLLFDAGNSRLKWAVLRVPYRRGQAFSAQGAVPLEALERGSRSLKSVFDAAGAEAVVHGCNVAGNVVARQIRAAAAEAGLHRTRFARSVASAAGVRNAYADPWRLGVDRWVALVGAHHEHPGRALCIASVGTALTIDWLAADGRHGGGSITPGPRLMIEALLDRTAGIRRRAGGRSVARTWNWPAAVTAAGGSSRRTPVRLFARDTHAALIAGSCHATAALIERSLREMRRRSSRARLLLAGGAAEAIAPLLTSQHWRADELVLRGLAVLAAADDTA